MNKVFLIILAGVMTVLVGCDQTTSSNVVAASCSPVESLIGQDISNPAQFGYRIINTYDHDPNAFTQGLIYHEGELYEGTGLNGRSSLRRVTLETGQVQQQIDIPVQYFGEGITLWNDKIIQLTWQARVGFVYERESFEKIEEFNYPTEGWGITHDGEQLIMSDGSSSLFFLNPDTFEEIRQVEVTDGPRSINRLNELEYINGEVFANVWQTNWIARIDPANGNVLGWINLAGILPLEDRGSEDVLNGIAYEADCGRLFITGKLWPKLFEIELSPEG